MHKRKDYYHAGGDNGKQGLVTDQKILFIKMDLDNYKSQPPDKKPSFFKRIARLWKGRTEVQKGK